MQHEEVYHEPAGSEPAPYERRDLDPRSIVMFAIGIIAAMLLALLITSLIIYYRAAQHVRRELPVPRLAKEREINPQPRLEVDAPSQLRDMRAGEDALLNSYGWIDKNSGIVRIPIERAMEILASQGLPARNSQPAKK